MTKSCPSTRPTNSPVICARSEGAARERNASISVSNPLRNCVAKFKNCDSREARDGIGHSCRESFVTVIKMRPAAFGIARLTLLRGRIR